MTDTTTVRIDTPIDDRKLVDSIVYLSALASEAKEIDPMLDTLRAITAKWRSDVPLNDENRHALEKLVTNLKDYLVNRDPLRSFTIEKLDERLANELGGTGKKTMPFMVLAAGCVVMSAAMVVFPFSLSNRIYLSLTMLLLSFTSVNVWLFLSSLHNFKPELRIVFSYISGSVVLLGLACLQYALIGVLQVTDQPLFRYGGATEIAMFAIIALYIGLRRYAKILNISIRPISAQLTTSLLGSIALTIALAFARNVPDKFFFSLSLGSMFVTGFFAFFGGQIVRLLRQNVTSSYAKSLLIVYIFQQAVTVTALLFVVALVWVGQLSVGALSLLIGFAAVPTLALFMYAGYSFKKETSR